MEVRFKEKKNRRCFVQRPKKLFGKTIWISLRRRKKIFFNLIFNMAWYASFPYIIYLVGLIFNVEIYSTELATSIGYIGVCIIFISYSTLRDSRIITIVPLDHNIIRFQYGKKDFKYYKNELIETKRKTIFGKEKSTFFSSLKDLRRQKLENLKYLF